MTVVTLPVMLLRAQGHGASGLASVIDAAVLGLVLVTQILFYVVAERAIHPNWWREMRYLPFVPIVGVGLVVNNTRGVIEALLGHRSEFVRTPKLGVLGRDEASAKSRAKTYVGVRDVAQPLVEVALGAYYVAMALAQLRHGMYAWGTVTLLLSAGLFTIGGVTLKALFAGREARRAGLPPLPAARAAVPAGAPVPSVHASALPAGVDA